MKLQIAIPNICISEQHYILNVMLTEFLGIDFEVKIHEGEFIELTRPGSEKILTINTEFFKKADQYWLETESLPSLPLKIFKPSNDGLYADLLPPTIPVLYGEPGIIKNKKYWHLNLDIFGSSFFMLSRYEEAVLQDRDQHDRFPATASIAFKEGFLNRPIVNEYVELLWAMMKALWPELERKKRSFRMILTHDVDEPFEFYKKPPIKMVKSIGGDILKRHSINLARERYRQWNAIRKGNHTTDPFYSFDFIMKESEKRGLKSAFYFIADHTAGVIDGIYSLNDPEIINLMKTIDARCHEIGLHTSYNTYLDKVQTRKEAELLRAVMRGNSIHQEPQGGRQHYLRWKTPETFQNWEYAGMQYDSTLGFADLPGFRCGTCWEYPAYDLINRKPLNLIERPLIAMDCTVTAERYMNKGLGEEAFEVFKSLKDTCRKYNGDFVLLWHNSELATEEQRRLYLSVLDS